MSVANLSNGRWHRDVTGTYEVRLLKGSLQLFPLLNCSVMVVEVLFVVKEQNPAVEYLLEFENANAKQRVRFTHEELGDEARLLSRSPACVAIEPGQHKFDCLRHCLMQDAQTAPRVAIVNTIGWYRWNTKLLYAHADGMICSECRDLNEKACDPAATAQLMDLIELEEACSDVPILAANQGLSEVRVELPPHLKRYRLVKPFSGSDGSKAVRAVVEMLLKNKTAAAYFGVAAIVTAVLTNPKFGLFLYGPSGSMKTAWAKILLSFLVPDANERDLVSFHSTTNALLATFSGLSNSVAVVDDYAPVNGYRQTAEEIRRADNFLRTIINGSGRSRCKADGTIREQARTSGLPILTGEALPDGLESLILRTVNVEITKSTFAEIAGHRPNEFEIYQRQAADGTFSKATWMLVSCL